MSSKCSTLNFIVLLLFWDWYCTYVVAVAQYHDSYVEINYTGLHEDIAVSSLVNDQHTTHCYWCRADDSAVGADPRAHGISWKVVFEWKYLDFAYPTFSQRRLALANRSFVPDSNLPLGVDIYGDRVFVTMPRWKDGVPASLGYVSRMTKERSPAIHPYPDWSSHGDPRDPDCDKLISIYRTRSDACGRLWAIDSGIVNALTNLTQVCPPKIVAFDLNTDKLILSYELPPSQVKQDSLHANILVDVRPERCSDAYVYVTDVWRFGLVVYSLAKHSSWRVTNYNFYPNPVASDFNVYGLNFQWLDGVFGMSLSPTLPHSSSERILYFHPMASFKEFMVSTRLLQDESLWNGNEQEVAKYFVEVGDRGALGQSSTSAISRAGIMFFTQVHRDEIGCWDTAMSYKRSNLALLGGSAAGTLIQFPNDLKLDNEQQQGLWVISNRLPIFLYRQLDYSDINFRILYADINTISANTVCAAST